MSHLDLNNLDQESWPVYRFDQIARSIGERVDPTTTDLETYIGLEHLDPESIHIRRFGKRDDVSGSKLRCYPGDVIFGRRRAYQRKAAVVKVDAFCSAHSLVLRAIPEVILPELFPFFLHSDSFMHRAIDISVGSLSPTINWKTLREQEFRLPPIELQCKFTELLSAGDSCAESLKALKTSSDALSRQMVNTLFQLSWAADSPLGAFDPSEFQNTHLRDICAESMFGPRFSSDLYSAEGRVASLRTTDLSDDGSINYNTMPTASLDEAEYKRHVLKLGDLLISRSGTCGVAAVFNEWKIPVIPAAFIIRFRLTERAEPEYIRMFFNSEIGRNITGKLASGAVQKNLNSQSLLGICIPLPNIETQRRLVRFVSQLGSRRAELHAENLHFLNKSLINHVF